MALKQSIIDLCAIIQDDIGNSSSFMEIIDRIQGELPDGLYTCFDKPISVANALKRTGIERSAALDWFNSLYTHAALKTNKAFLRELDDSIKSIISSKNVEALIIKHAYDVPITLIEAHPVPLIDDVRKKRAGRPTKEEQARRAAEKNAKESTMQQATVTFAIPPSNDQTYDAESDGLTEDIGCNSEVTNCLIMLEKLQNKVNKMDNMMRIMLRYMPAEALREYIMDNPSILFGDM